MARLSIRRFRPGDLARILQIERAAFPDEPYTREIFLDLYRRCAALFLLATIERRVVAYVSTCILDGRAEVVSIAVDPRSRRRGIGAALMRRTLALLRSSEVGLLDLTVRPENRAAIHFYRGFGFRYLRTIPAYYQDGGAGVRMRLPLSP